MSKKYYNALSQSQFEERIKNIQPNIKILGKYENMHNKIKYVCKTCGTEGIADCNSLVRGLSKCGKCNNKRKLIVGFNDIATLYPQYSNFFVNKEDMKTHTFGSGEKVLMRCPICGNERLYVVNKLFNNNFSCPKCGDGYSYPNRFMYGMLSQLKIKFKREVVFKWSNNKIYDFVVNKNIIEMDGGFHKGSKYISFESEKANDDLKDKMAMENGYNIFRIECFVSNFDYIKNNILKSKLNTFLPLDKVNWNDLKYDLINTNLVKISSNEFNKYKCKLSIKEISKNLNITTNKLSGLLTIGNSLGWCDYQAKESLRGKYTPLKENHNSKKIICNNDGKIFNSTMEADNYYGLKKDSCGKVCRGYRLSCKGLSFDFLEDKSKFKENRLKEKKQGNLKKVICINTGKIYSSASEASRDIKHSVGYVSNLINKNKISKEGYIFKYLDT